MEQEKTTTITTPGRHFAHICKMGGNENGSRLPGFAPMLPPILTAPERSPKRRRIPVIFEKKKGPIPAVTTQPDFFSTGALFATLVPRARSAAPPAAVASLFWDKQKEQAAETCHYRLTVLENTGDSAAECSAIFLDAPRTIT